MGRMHKTLGIFISMLVLSGCESDFSVSKVYHSVSSTNSLTAGPLVSASPTPSPSPTLSCDYVLQQTGKDLRVLFMFDNSNSTDTTDPKKLRVEAMRNFIQVHGAQQNLTYSFSYFAKNAVTIDPISLSPVSSSSHPFGDSNYLSQAVNFFAIQKSEPNTGFANALTMLQNIIATDLTQDSKKDYAIVFMSDGGASDNSTLESRNKQIQDMQSMVSAAGHELTMSTVYFGPTEEAFNTLTKDDLNNIYGIFAPYSELVGNLQAMATTGKGQYVNTNLMADGTIAVGSLIAVPGEVCVYK